MIDLEGIVRSAKNLAPLPGTADRLTALLATEERDLAGIAHAVCFDIALTGRLLRLANSAMVRGSGPVVTVGDAVTELGTAALLAVVSEASQETLDMRLKACEEDKGTLWQHAVAAALAVTTAGRHCGAMPPEETFVAALLHDVGFLALDRWLMKVPFGQEREDARASVQGLDHARLAGLVAESWRLSQPLQRALVHHHRPMEAPDERSRLIASFVQVADCVAKTIGADFASEDTALDRATTELLRLDRDGFDAMCYETRELLGKVLKHYS